ncbi:hypothetical protein GLOIN_2v1435777 [Rhizophagus irregularis DAOM 181602=DAOM 197198]|nr:hypothetical protein GLOIN_2v1435777 [Rhizophagus irregularis DAOM 181602=DAOM 197198]
MKKVINQKKLLRGYTSILQDIVQEKVDYYLDELIYEMEIKTGKLVSIPTLCRSLQHCGITRKKSKKKGSIYKGKHYTILPALTVDGFIAADIMEGSCDKDRFRTFIITQVLPQMNPYPGENSVLIMDNARIHYDEDLVKSVEEFGCRILYLPLYSPNLNPIETAFSVLKSWLKRYRDIVNNCDDSIYIFFVALSQTTSNMAKQYFQQSIYM